MHASLPQHKACQLQFAHPVHLRAAAARPRHSTQRARVVTRAELGSMLDTVITWGALAAGVGATVYAVFYDWHGGTQHKQRQQQQQSTALLGPGDNFSWAVMGGVSFIPLFNYLVSLLEQLHPYGHACPSANNRSAGDSMERHSMDQTVADKHNACIHACQQTPR